jgi:hypothetical protein
MAQPLVVSIKISIFLYRPNILFFHGDGIDRICKLVN